MKVKTLNDCLNARWPLPSENYVKCAVGHQLADGRITRKKAEQEIACKVCQRCNNFMSMEDDNV